MKDAKLASGMKADGPRTSAGQKKFTSAKAKPARSVRKNTGAKSMVCRYCGSDDLAPSFVKRRDRRCRKCFSKRYGSTQTKRSKRRK